MRNLKRALSMLLSSTMVLGMVAMGGSAAGYQDVDDTYNKEAIEVLQAAGIMTGDENGNFAPETTVTRNQMAVIMANLMAYNVASYAGTSPFTDVPEWAEPYVAACWTNGITAGIGDNLYGGDQEVTTSQAALMIMKALGYFQYQSDFGGDWQLSTVTQGNKIDLFNNVDSGVKAAMTRNDVAQLVLNGLEAGMVEADDNTLNVTTPDGTVVEAGRVTYNYVTSGQDYATAIDDVLFVNGNATDVSTNGAIVQLGEKLYQGSLKKTDSIANGNNRITYTDVFGRPATRWEYQSKEIGVYTEEATHTFSDEVTTKELYDLIGKTAVENYDLSVTIDGMDLDSYVRSLGNAYSGLVRVDGDDAYFIDADRTAMSVLRNSLIAGKTDDVKEFLSRALDGSLADGATGVANTGNGVRTEVYVDAVKGEVHIALTHFYAAEVYKVDEENGYITLSDFYNNDKADREDQFTTTDFSEDEVVMYSFADNQIQEVYAATRVEGKVTEATTNTTDVNGKNFVMDGTKYFYNKTVKEDELLTSENVNNNMVGYLDQYGYVSYIDEAAVSYDYAYVLSMGSDDDIYGNNNDNNSAATVYARLVLADGSVLPVQTDTKFDDINDVENHIVSYTVNKSGVYTLSVKDQDDVNKNMLGADGLAYADDLGMLRVRNGVASFTAPDNTARDADGNVTAVGTDNYVMNSNTVFIVADTNGSNDVTDYDFYTYTGVKNVPDMDVDFENGASTTWVAVAADKDNVAKVVYVQDADVSGAGNVTFTLANSGANFTRNDEIGDYYSISAVVDGEVVTLKVKDDSKAYDLLVDGESAIFTDPQGVVVKENNAGAATKVVVALESITYDANGLVTNVRLYEARVDGGAGDTDGDGYKVGVGGTSKSTKEIVGLGTLGSSAWYEDAPVVRYDTYAEKFVVSSMGTVKDDDNDQVLAVYAERVVNGLCIVEYKTGAAVIAQPVPQPVETVGGGILVQDENVIPDPDNTNIDVETGDVTLDFTWTGPIVAAQSNRATSVAVTMPVTIQIDVTYIRNGETYTISGALNGTMDVATNQVTATGNLSDIYDFQKGDQVYLKITGVTGGSSSDVAITAASATVDKPVFGGTLSAEATAPEGANYTATVVTWTLDGEPAAIGDEVVAGTYVATVDFTPNTGYKFDSTTVYTVNNVEGDTATFTVEDTSNYTNIESIVASFTVDKLASEDDTVALPTTVALNVTGLAGGATMPEPSIAWTDAAGADVTGEVGAGTYTYTMTLVAPEKHNLPAKVTVNNTELDVVNGTVTGTYTVEAYTPADYEWDPAFELDTAATETAPAKYTMNYYLAKGEGETELAAYIETVVKAAADVDLVFNVVEVDADMENATLYNEANDTRTPVATIALTQLFKVTLDDELIGYAAADNNGTGEDALTLDYTAADNKTLIVGKAPTATPAIAASGKLVVEKTVGLTGKAYVIDMSKANSSDVALYTAYKLALGTNITATHYLDAANDTADGEGYVKINSDAGAAHNAGYYAVPNTQIKVKAGNVANGNKLLFKQGDVSLKAEDATDTTVVLSLPVTLTLNSEGAYDTITADVVYKLNINGSDVTINGSEYLDIKALTDGKKAVQVSSADGFKAGTKYVQVSNATDDNVLATNDPVTVDYVAETDETGMAGKLALIGIDTTKAVDGVIYLYPAVKVTLMDESDTVWGTAVTVNGPNSLTQDVTLSSDATAGTDHSKTFYVAYMGAESNIELTSATGSAGDLNGKQIWVKKGTAATAKFVAVGDAGDATDTTVTATYTLDGTDDLTFTISNTDPNAAP